MRTTLLTGLTFLPALLGAQHGPATPRPQIRCAAYDSLMQGVDPAEPGVAAIQSSNGNRFISIGGPFAVRGDDEGITRLTFAIRATRGQGVGEASMQVTVFLNEQNERPLDERQGMLILDDSVRIDLGSMSESAGDPYPNGKKSWFIYGPVPRGSLVRLARARTLDLKVGSSRYALSATELRDLRGGLAALACSTGN